MLEFRVSAAVRARKFVSATSALTPMLEWLWQLLFLHLCKFYKNTAILSQCPAKH
jgi:hypothetical protein